MENGHILRDGSPEDILREVELTDRIGIMSLQIPKYFSQFPILRRDELPLTPEEGVGKFKSLGLEIDEENIME